MYVALIPFFILFSVSDYILGISEYHARKLCKKQAKPPIINGTVV